MVQTANMNNDTDLLNGMQEDLATENNEVQVADLRLNVSPTQSPIEERTDTSVEENKLTRAMDATDPNIYDADEIEAQDNVVEAPIAGKQSKEQRVISAAKESEGVAQYKEFVEDPENVAAATYLQVPALETVREIQELTPFLTKLAIKAGLRTPEMVGRMGVRLGQETLNLGIGVLDAASPWTSMEAYYVDETPIFTGKDPYWIDTWGEPWSKQAHDYLDKELKVYGDELRQWIGDVPIEKRNVVHKILGKSAQLAAPILPFMTGLGFFLKSPKLMRAAMQAGETFGGAAKKTGKAYLSKQKDVFLGTGKAAIGGGVAWQAAEMALADTAYEGMAPIFAIPGAMAGIDRMVRFPVNVAFGATLAAMIKAYDKFGVGISGEYGTGSRFSKLGTMALAMAQGIPLTEIFKKWNNPEELRNLIGLGTSKHMAYINKLAEGLVDLPAPYHKIMYESLERQDYFIKKYGEDGAKMNLLVGQVVGLAVTNGLARASLHSHKAGLFRSIDKITVQTSIEETQHVIQNQIDAIANQLYKEIEKIQPFAKDENLATLRTNIEKLVDQSKKDAADNKTLIDDMANSSSVMLNTQEAYVLSNMAGTSLREGGFGWDANFSGTRKEMVEKNDVFVDSVESLITENVGYAKREVNAAYQLIKDNPITLDATFLVNAVKELREEFLRPALNSLTRAGRSVKNKSEFVSFLRQNMLKNVELNDLRSLVEKFKETASEASEEYGFRTLQGNILKRTDWDKIIKAEGKIANPDEAADYLRDTLSRLEGVNDASAKLLDDSIPPIVDLGELISFRGELLDAYRRTMGNKEGYAIGELEGKVTQFIDDALEARKDKIKTTDEAGNEIEISYAEAYADAKEKYKKLLLPWKSAVGTQSQNSVYKNGGIEDTLGPEHMLALLTRTKNPDTMVELFEGLFQVPSNNPFSRDNAVELFQLTIGRILAGDYPKFKDAFVNDLTYIQIGKMEKAGMITPHQADNLQVIVKKKLDYDTILQDETTKLAHDNVVKNVIPEFKKFIDETLGPNSELALKIKGLDTSDKIFEVLLEENMLKVPSLTPEGVKPFVTKMREGLYEGEAIIKAKGTDVRGYPFGESDITLKGLKNNVEDVALDSFSGQIVDFIVKNPKFSREKKLEYLTGIEQMMMFQMYKRSFKLTSQRDPSRLAEFKYTNTGKLELSEMYEAAKHSGLMRDIDITTYAHMLETTFPVFKATAAAKQGLGDNLARETFENLAESFEMMRYSLAKIADVNIDDVGRGISMASGLSRVWAVARGVVSLRFVVSEAFIRQQHMLKVKYINEILTNPETVKIIHDVVVHGKKPTLKQAGYWKRLTVDIFGNYANDAMPDAEFSTWIEHVLGSDRGTTLSGAANIYAPEVERKVITTGDPRTTQRKILQQNIPPNTIAIPPPASPTRKFVSPPQ